MKNFFKINRALVAKKKLKLFSLALMALFATGVWADETYYLQTPGATTPALTGDFYTTATLNQAVSCSYDAVNYTQSIKFGSQASTSTGNYTYTDRCIRYDCRTNKTEIKVIAYSTNASKKVCYWHVTQGALGSDGIKSSMTSNTTTLNDIQTYEYTITADKPSSFYLGTDANNVYIVQVIAVEKGSTTFPRPGANGYVLNFKKGRVNARNGYASIIDKTASTDGIEIHQNQNYEPGNTTSAKMQTNNTNYIKFTVATPMVLNFTTSSTTKYNVSKTKGSDTDQITPTADQAKVIKLTSAGTYYINPQGSNVTPTGMSFSAAPKVTYNANGGGGSMDQTYFTVAANGFTAPDGKVFKEWNDKADGTGNVYEVDADVESDVTLYAQWVQKYTIIYNANGGNGTMTDANSPYFAGDEVTLLENTFTAPNASSAWSGWDVYKTGDAETKVTVTDGKFTMPAYNVTVAAQWATAYDVKFYQGYGEPDAQIGETQSIGEGAFAVAPSDPERDGYEFAGWSISASADDIKNVASYAITEATNFTAIWKQLFDITKASVSHGSITVSAESAIEGATVTLTATPATDYLFEAWDVYKTDDAETKVEVNDGKFTMPAYAVTVSASFVTDTRTKILYLTTASTTNDKLYAALKDDYNVKVETPASQTLTNYALIVLHESLDGNTYYNNAAVAGCKTTSVPVLNTKSYFYTSARWNWGAPNAGKNVKGCSLNSTTYQYVSYHPIFADVVDDGFVEIIDEAEAKAMQPVGSFTTGLDGYTLATTPNADNGNGCAIHEIPAGNTTRGANTGKYLMISVSNSALGKLNANGQKLFQNAVAYLLSNDAWSPSTTPTSISNTASEIKTVKRLENGMLVIEKDGKTYNVMGQAIR